MESFNSNRDINLFMLVVAICGAMAVFALAIGVGLGIYTVFSLFI